MPKFMRRAGNVVLVWVVVSMIVIDSAWACRWRGCRARHGAPAYYESPELGCGGGWYQGEWYQEAAPGIAAPGIAAPGIPAAPSASDVDPPLAPPVAPIPSAEETPPVVSAPAIVEPVPAAISPLRTPEAAPVVRPAPGPASSPAAPTAAPRPPALSPDEDDPFAPLPPPAAPKAPTARPAIPRTVPDDDDPFAPLPARPATPPAVAPAPAIPARPAADPAADPFKILAQSEQPVRDWVDDTGLFRTRGQLVAILEGKVRILKETGRTTTVPLSRLSTVDRQYIEESKP